jgi:hypothetical protein
MVFQLVMGSIPSPPTQEQIRLHPFRSLIRCAIAHSGTLAFCEVYNVYR